MANILDKNTIETIYETAADILATVGVEFDMDSARELFEKHGARIEGKKVCIPPPFYLKPLG